MSVGNEIIGARVPPNRRITCGRHAGKIYVVALSEMASFAGSGRTTIGVWKSTDLGVTWAPVGTTLDMEPYFVNWEYGFSSTVDTRGDSYPFIHVLYASPDYPKTKVSRWNMATETWDRDIVLPFPDFYLYEPKEFYGGTPTWLEGSWLRNVYWTHITSSQSNLRLFGAKPDGFYYLAGGSSVKHTQGAPLSPLGPGEGNVLPFAWMNYVVFADIDPDSYFVWDAAPHLCPNQILDGNRTYVPLGVEAAASSGEAPVELQGFTMFYGETTPMQTTVRVYLDGGGYFSDSHSYALGTQNTAGHLASTAHRIWNGGYECCCVVFDPTYGPSVPADVSSHSYRTIHPLNEIGIGGETFCNHIGLPLEPVNFWGQGTLHGDLRVMLSGRGAELRLLWFDVSTLRQKMVSGAGSFCSAWQPALGESLATVSQSVTQICGAQELQGDLAIMYSTLDVGGPDPADIQFDVYFLLLPLVLGQVLTGNGIPSEEAFGKTHGVTGGGDGQYCGNIDTNRLPDGCNEPSIVESSTAPACSTTRGMAM